MLQLIYCFPQGMPIQYLVLEDTDEIITLVEDKNKVKQIQEDEQEEEEEDEDEKENNNQGVQLISEKPIVIRQKVQSASAMAKHQRTLANHHSHFMVATKWLFHSLRSLEYDRFDF